MDRLYNIYSREDLMKQRLAEHFSRKTVSFYRYVQLADLHELRDSLYANWFSMGVLGHAHQLCQRCLS